MYIQSFLEEIVYQSWQHPRHSKGLDVESHKHPYVLYNISVCKGVREQFIQQVVCKKIMTTFLLFGEKL